MDLIALSPTAYQLRGGANAGLIVADRRAVLVDAGLDRDAARRILRHIESLKITLAAIAITHAHADHFGGAAALRGRTGASVYAPALEAAVVANPILEPLYLFSGAMPPAELRHKFTLAEGCPVDGELAAGETEIGGVPLRILPAPGHAPNQMMIAGGGACFVADACFAPEILRKHGIPFYVDVDEAAASLAALPGLEREYEVFVPGHGPAVEKIAPWAAENAGRLADIRSAVARALATTGEISEIVRLTADRLAVAIENPVIYWLTQTTVHACLASLQKARQARVETKANRLAWLPPDQPV